MTDKLKAFWKSTNAQNVSFLMLFGILSRSHNVYMWSHCVHWLNSDHPENAPFYIKYSVVFILLFHEAIEQMMVFYINSSLVFICFCHVTNRNLIHYFYSEPIPASSQMYKCNVFDWLKDYSCYTWQERPIKKHLFLYSLVKWTGSEHDFKKTGVFSCMIMTGIIIHMFKCRMMTGI